MEKGDTQRWERVKSSCCWDWVAPLQGGTNVMLFARLSLGTDAAGIRYLYY